MAKRDKRQKRIWSLLENSMGPDCNIFEGTPTMNNKKNNNMICTGITVVSLSLLLVEICLAFCISSLFSRETAGVSLQLMGAGDIIEFHEWKVERGSYDRIASEMQLPTIAAPIQSNCQPHKIPRTLLVESSKRPSIISLCTPKVLSRSWLCRGSHCYGDGATRSWDYSPSPLNFRSSTSTGVKHYSRSRLYATPQPLETAQIMTASTPGNSTQKPKRLRRILNKLYLLQKSVQNKFRNVFKRRNNFYHPSVLELSTTDLTAGSAAMTIATPTIKSTTITTRNSNAVVHPMTTIAIIDNTGLTKSTGIALEADSITPYVEQNENDLPHLHNTTLSDGESIHQKQQEASQLNNSKSIVAAPTVDLSGSWSLIVSKDFMVEYDFYLASLGQPGFVRSLAKQLIGMTYETTLQSNNGASLFISSKNPRGTWNREFITTDDSDCDDCFIQTTVQTADAERVTAEAWWENSGEVHVSWLRGSKKYNGDFEAKRFLEEENIYVCESVFHPNEGHKESVAVTWRFQRQ